ncbi:hypothetical protein [Sphingomonas sp. 3-13AW]|uniref:hypothetical protein n=1 Tax=Sphingomonas sp. 3-13AW TaxID=3050450 RepID=UPI003BB54887
MVKLFDFGELREFPDADAIVAHFSLQPLSPADFSGIKAASDAGFPLHAAIDPYTEELQDLRVLLLEPSAAELDEELATRRWDI